MAPQNPFPLIRPARERLERIGQEFLADFLSTATRQHPENVQALAELAHVLTRMGRFEEGYETDLQLLRLAPENPTVHYNLACSLALLGRPESALDALEKAIELGYDDPEHLLADDDLAPLRDAERFQDLLRRLQVQ